MAKVEGMRGKDNSKPVFVKKGAPNNAPTFRNNNVNNNNKRPNVERDVAGDKRVKMEGRQLAENCKFCDKPGHRAEECWKKLGSCLRCGGRDHRIPDCPMMKDQPVRKQINNHTKDTRNLSWFGPSHMEVLRPVPKQTLGISLTKGTVPLMDLTPSTPAGLLLFPRQEGSPLLLQTLVVFE
ncbi:hypothetical protein Taro_024262, partial [Colocasia esculenta]|nr:hypothetical protein [Colocasia esculenta]